MVYVYLVNLRTVLWLLNYWLFPKCKIPFLLLKISFRYLGFINNPYVKRIVFFVFCVYKNVSQKHIFVYKWTLQYLPSVKYNVPVFIYTKSKKVVKRFYIQKSGHFTQSKTISVTFLYTKIETLYVTQFFMEILKLTILYKKHDTLHYVTFLYTKIQTLSKKQDNLRSVFIYKNTDTLRYAIFHWIFEIGGGGGGGYMQKNNALCITFLYVKNSALSVTFLHTKSLTLCVTFLCAKNNALCFTFLYLNFIV